MKEPIKAETKAEPKKAGRKPAAKKTAPAKKAAAPAKAKQKAPARKAKTAAKAESTPVMKIQFGGDEFDVDAIKQAVEADRKANVKGRVKTLEIYVKPEERAVYYVVNSDGGHKINL